MSRRNWLLFAAMCVIWGIPYLLIRVAVRDISPPALVFARTGIAVLMLLPIALWRRELFPAFRRWRPLLAYTLVELTIPWLLLSDAETKLSSSLTGLLVAAVPLAGVIMVQFIGGGDQMSRSTLVGLLMGIVGVGALVGLDLGTLDAFALLEVAGVVLGYALGPIILSRSLSDLPAMGVVTASLVITAVIYLPFALADPPTRLTGGAVASVLVLASVCTALAFLLFFALIAGIGPARATVITYVNPAVAVLLGVIALDEAFTVGMAVGFPLILIGSILGARRRASGRARGVRGTVGRLGVGGSAQPSAPSRRICDAMDAQRRPPVTLSTHRACLLTVRIAAAGAKLPAHARRVTESLMRFGRTSASRTAEELDASAASPTPDPPAARPLRAVTPVRPPGEDAVADPDAAEPTDRRGPPCRPAPGADRRHARRPAPAQRGAAPRSAGRGPRAAAGLWQAARRAAGRARTHRRARARRRRVAAERHPARRPQRQVAGPRGRRAALRDHRPQPRASSRWRSAPTASWTSPCPTLSPGLGEDLEKAIGKKVRLLLGTPGRDQARDRQDLSRTDRRRQRGPAVRGDVRRARRSSSCADVSAGASGEAPVVKVVNMIITQALRDRASDVHIEPQDGRVRVRFRIDGALHDVLELPARWRPPSSAASRSSAA